MANKKITVIQPTKPLHSSDFQSYSKRRLVAAYARVSTDHEEQESSFEAQVSYYEQKIKANPAWQFVEVYSDEGITGTSMKKRDGFNRMIKDALAGKIDLILTKSVSRFARNTVDSLTTVRKLKDKGVEVFFEKENIYTLDSKGELLITIMSSLAQEEARSISENTAWGHRKRFADGKFSLAYSTFLGYDKGPDGELVINEEQAVIVRRIYDDYLAGLSPYTIAKRLTEDGIETPAHKTVWQASTVYSILKNEKYYGAAILQKCITTDFLSKKQIKNTGQLPQYYIANDHEAIIPPEKFKMVQDEMQRREDAGFKAQCVSIFSARIVCGDCGGFYGRKIWHAGSKYASWRWHCNNKFQKRKYCSTPTLKEESLKEAFLEVFNGLIKRRDKIEKNYNRCLDAITDTSEYERQLEELNKGCAEVRQLIKSLLISHGKQSEDENISDMYAEYENRLDTLAKLKQKLDMKIAACSAKRTQVNGFLSELKKHGQLLVEFDDLVWQAVIHHARVDNNNTITFVFRDGTEVTTPIKNGVKPYKNERRRSLRMSNAIPIIIEPHEPERGKYRVAAYCRVSSSSDEQMHSYYAQVGYYKKLFAEADSYVFVGVYGDAGISGTRTCNRDGFLKLIEDCRNGLVDCIWTKSVSRFGRNTVDTLIFTRELRNLGIDVFFEKENIHSIDSSGELLLTLMAAFAESESKNMSDNIAWGKRRRFAEGLVQTITIGNLLGFRQENGVVTVVEEEAEIVRKIFHKYLDCYNFGEIAEMLNQENAPKRFKGKWSRTEVRNIILNEKYAGDCLLQKYYVVNPLEHKRAPNTGQLAQYFVEGCFPAIVKKDDWLVAQEMAKSLSNRSVVNSDERPFVGMMYCAVCGKQCKIHTTVGMGGNPLRRYRCVSFKDNSGVEIPGMTYVRPHTSRYIKNPTPKLKAWREKYAPPRMTRQYYCSDTRIEADHPYEVFIKAWNYLVTNRQRYLPTIYNMISAEDVLLRFNASVMYKLLSKGDMLHEFDTRLFRKTVDRIEVHPSGKLTFMFKTGLNITK